MRQVATGGDSIGGSHKGIHRQDFSGICSPSFGMIVFFVYLLAFVYSCMLYCVMWFVFGLKSGSFLEM